MPAENVGDLTDVRSGFGGCPNFDKDQLAREIFIRQQVAGADDIRQFIQQLQNLGYLLFGDGNGQCNAGDQGIVGLACSDVLDVVAATGKIETRVSTPALFSTKMDNVCFMKSSCQIYDIIAPNFVNLHDRKKAGIRPIKISGSAFAIPDR